MLVCLLYSLLFFVPFSLHFQPKVSTFESILNPLGFSLSLLAMELSPEKELPPQRRVNRKQSAKCRGIGVWSLVSLTAVAALRPFISRRGGLWAFFHVHQQRTTFVAAGVLYTHEIYQDPTVADLGRDRRLYFFLSNQKG